MNFELVLSQNEKNINGSLTLSTLGNPKQSTINIQGFIEGETISLNGELGSMLGTSVKMNIQGNVKGDKIFGKFSVSGMMSGEAMDLELSKID